MTFIFKRTLLNKKVLKLGILITGIALALISFITFYGQHVGNFVMSMDDKLQERSVYMSTDIGFKEKYTFLSAKPVNEARDMTYTNVNLVGSVLGDTLLSKIDDQTEEGLKEKERLQDEVYGKYDNGNYIDPDRDKFKYICYRFYITNEQKANVEMSYSLLINQATKDIDKSIRIMTVIMKDPEEKINSIYDVCTNNGKDPFNKEKFNKEILNYQNIYMLDDLGKGDGNKFYDDNDYTNYPKKKLYAFESNSKVFTENNTYTNNLQVLEQDRKIMFIIYMWLEGSDPHTTNAILGGKIKIQMQFKAITTDEDK